MNKLNILHLSDLHYCEKTKKDIIVVHKALIEDLRKLIQNDPSLHPNIVIFSGDLAFSGIFSDFNSAYNLFLQPILNLLGLDDNSLLICPGNHDIERDKVKDYIEVGLKESLKTRENTNILIDTIQDDDPNIFSRLSSFNQFRNEHENSHIIKKHPFFSAYHFTLNEKKVGVVCMNSAWRSFGGDENDLGKLIIGERNMLEATESILTCDLKIGVVHHPFSFLMPFEQIELERQVHQVFDIWLHGHQHEPNVEYVKQLNQRGSLTVAGGALYQSRDYHNGYSIISISLANNTGSIYLREYFDRTKKFEKAVAYAIDGIVDFEIEKKTGPSSKLATINSQIKHATSLKTMGSSIAELSVNPKTLEDVFVEPPLALESEESFLSREIIRRGKKKIIRSKKDTIRNLDVLLASQGNILFVGKKEGGKTSLLKYINNLVLENAFGELQKIPFLINYKNLPQGKERTLKAINSAVTSLGLSLNIQQELQAGNCLVLIDDFDFENEKNLADFKSFVTNYPDNRYIFSTDERVIIDIGIADLPDVGIKYEKVYIHSLKFKQVKEMAKKWFGKESMSEKKIDSLAEQLINSITAINVPSNPLIVSLLLLIVEQQSEYTPINRAALMEEFVEILLQKRNILDTKSSSFDFRNKEDLLSHIAHVMDSQNDYQLTLSAFYSEVESYFRQRGLTHPRQLESFVFENFINRGVLSELDGKIFFRFRCFTEYFIAKYISENNEFLKQILEQDDVLVSYLNELDYLTGLQRKNKDLIEYVGARVDNMANEYFSKTGLDVTLEKLSSISLIAPVEPKETEIEKDDAIAQIRKNRLTEEQRDEFFDNLHAVHSDANQKIERKKPETLELKMIGGLVLLATMVKNCELIADKEFKQKYVNLCVELYLKFLYTAIAKFGDQIEKFDDETVLHYLSEQNFDVTLEDIKNAKTEAVVMYPLLLTLQTVEIINKTLGTSKLDLVFDEQISNRENHIAKRLVYTLIYASLELPAYLDRLEKIEKEIIDNDFYCEIVKLKLLHIYDFKKLSVKQKNQIENMIAGIIVRKQDHSNLRKASVIADLRSRRLKNLEE